MKKTLTKTTALLLVFAMLLSVFAVFAGSASARGEKKEPKVSLQEYLEYKFEKAAKRFQKNAEEAIEALPGNIVDYIEGKVTGAATEIVGPLTLTIPKYADAIAELEAIAKTYTNPFAKEGEGPHTLDLEAKDFEFINNVFGINLVLAKARLALGVVCSDAAQSAQVATYAEYQNIMDGFKAELSALVKIRDDKCCLLLDVLVAEGSVIGAAKNAVGAVVTLGVAPQRVINILQEAKGLFMHAGEVAEDVKYIANGKDHRVSTFRKTFKDVKVLFDSVYQVATKGVGTAVGVKAAVATVQNFPATVGAIGDNVKAYGEAIQALFGYVFKLA